MRRDRCKRLCVSSVCVPQLYRSLAHNMNELHTAEGIYIELPTSGVYANCIIQKRLYNANI